MRDDFEIACDHSGAKLRFHDPQRSARGGFTTCRVRLEAPSARADFELYDFTMERLGEFFAELADHWKGWHGAIRWESVEDQAWLSATTDGLGHVSLAFELREHGRTRRADLAVSGTLQLEAGKLEFLSFAAQDFVAQS